MLNNETERNYPKMKKWLNLCIERAHTGFISMKLWNFVRMKIRHSIWIWKKDYLVSDIFIIPTNAKRKLSSACIDHLDKVQESSKQIRVVHSYIYSTCSNLWHIRSECLLKEWQYIHRKNWMTIEGRQSDSYSYESIFWNMKQLKKNIT
jgi:hypothetical protein